MRRDRVSTGGGTRRVQLVREGGGGPARPPPPPRDPSPPPPPPPRRAHPARPWSPARAYARFTKRSRAALQNLPGAQAGPAADPEVDPSSPGVSCLGCVPPASGAGPEAPGDSPPCAQSSAPPSPAPPARWPASARTRHGRVLTAQVKRPVKGGSKAGRCAGGRAPARARAAPPQPAHKEEGEGNGVSFAPRRAKRCQQGPASGRLPIRAHRGTGLQLRLRLAQTRLRPLRP